MIRVLAAMMAGEKRVLAMALGSRIAVLGAMWIWSALGSPYDSSAALDPPCLSQNPEQEQGGFSSSRSRIARSVVWDGVYYLRIARCGYEYEQMYAFQPLLPLLMRSVSNTVLSGFIAQIGYAQTLALSGYTINLIAFILAALYLYRLGLYVLEDEKMSFLATAFFCVNPASVFYSSLYTESLFALLSFSGMWYLVTGSKWKSALAFGLSSITRSNGVVHAGFFLFQCMHLVLRFNERQLAVVIIECGLLVCCVFAPFVAFQIYGFYQLCSDDSSVRPWCTSNIPYLYGFVQSHYWDVGFLRYFRLKQTPNFLSASPSLLLASAAFVTYARAQPVYFSSLGLSAPHRCKRKAALLPMLPTSKSQHEGAAGFSSVANVPFVFELCFMTSVAFLAMHVQVSTRFLSCSPVIYWFAALLQKQNAVGDHTLWYVFISYTLVGTLLFVNFYPFT